MPAELEFHSFIDSTTKMPPWWGKRSTKNKGQQNQYQEEEFHCSRVNFSKSSIKPDNNKSRDKLEGFDEASASSISQKSPRSSRDLGFSGGGPSGGSSGFSGFDSDNAERRGHPLPQPSISSSHAFVIDHGAGIGSGSASVSSVSSSGSSDDHSIGQNHGCQFVVFRGPVDAKMDPSTVWRNPIGASDSPRADSTARSSGAGSRGPTSPTSPLNPRLCRFSLDSTSGKAEEGKSQCHPLPLPPGSPTSPSGLPNIRSVGAAENAASQPCWKKGRLLGRGTFGHVYLGFNSVSGQMCAIKEVKVIGDDSSSKESLKQLNQEINLLSQLSHPNIVRYYGSQMGDEALSVYLEYVSGGSIYKLLQEYGAFKEPVIQNYTRKIVAGLAYLHARNTVHRDIKGANILVDPNGEIKLADFGMAKHITNCTSMLSFKGSPHWMAPEVVMNTNGYSLAVDIWSLGCTVLEMATSKPPWSKYEGVAAIFKIGNSKEIPEIPEHLSNDARSFVRLCLQREPSARPTAAQLLEHPFVRDHPSPRVLDSNIPDDFFPFAFDGSQTPPRIDHHGNRKSISNCDGEYLRKPVVTTSRAMARSSENIRLIASLPVSPSSSPLRHYGHEQRSFPLSPPHPSYAKAAGQNGHSNWNNFSLYPMKPTAIYNLDPDPLIRVHTPGGSPRSRPV